MGKLKWAARLVGLVMIVAVLSMIIPGASQQASAQVAPYPTTVTYNIYATDGWWREADDVPIYMYGYIGGKAGTAFTYLAYAQNAIGGSAMTMATGAPTPTAGPVTAAEAQFAGHAQRPGPVIWARTGDTVIINFKNLGVVQLGPPNDPHSIHLHGLDVDTANDGVPETSVGAVPANSLMGGAGNVVVYQFSTNFPGTYMYHCHQEASIHVQMGMVGAIVIYNPRDAAAITGPGMGAGGTEHGFAYDKDYLMLLTDVEPRQSASELLGPNNPLPWNPVLFQPSYWLINGLSFPNTIHAVLGLSQFSWANWIASHPNYDPMITGSVTGVGTNHAGTGTKVLVRMINLGFQAYPMHIHGFHPKLIAMDQRPWTWSNPPGLATGSGLEMNTFNIASGNTMDILLDFQSIKTTTASSATAAQATYPAGTYTKYTTGGITPVLNTNTALTSVPIPDLFSPISAVYAPGPTIPTEFVFHNHNDYPVTNNGIYPGGQLTVVVGLP